MTITYSLSQLHSLISQWFKQLFGQFSCNITGDISNIKHYKHRRYITLIEPGNNHEILASIKGIIFNESIVDYIISQYQCSTSDLIGKTITWHGKLMHHAQYGISFIIESLTIIDISMRIDHATSIIQQLSHEWIYHQNRLLNRRQHTHRIALISGEWSEWCRDVLALLDESPYRLVCQTFYCSIHGNDAAEAVKHQLQIIRDIQLNQDTYDIIMIVRGWGDTSWFARQDNYDLAKEICLSPLPVIVAIGHTSNTSILDSICHTSAKTPSDSAYRIIHKLESTIINIQILLDDITYLVAKHLYIYQQNIDILIGNIQSLAISNIRTIQLHLYSLYEYINSHHPQHIYNMWYSYITTSDNQPVNEQQLSNNHAINVIIHTSHGSYQATINNHQKL